MSTKVFGGIDPGLTGALAVIRPDGSVEFFDAPTVEIEMTKKSKAGNVRHRHVFDVHEMARLVRLSGVEFVTVEKLWAMKIPGQPNQSSTSWFSLGVGYGFWQGVLAALGVPFQLVAPATWKGVVMAGEPKTKEASVPFASRLYPAAAEHLRTPRGRLLHGRADALLLAHLGRAGTSVDGQ